MSVRDRFRLPADPEVEVVFGQVSGGFATALRGPDGVLRAVVSRLLRDCGGFAGALAAARGDFAARRRAVAVNFQV